MPLFLPLSLYKFPSARVEEKSARVSCFIKIVESALGLIRAIPALAGAISHFSPAVETDRRSEPTAGSSKM
jgi:hypothetical protein